MIQLLIIWQFLLLLRSLFSSEDGGVIVFCSFWREVLCHWISLCGWNRLSHHLLPPDDIKSVKCCSPQNSSGSSQRSALCSTGSVWCPSSGVLQYHVNTDEHVDDCIHHPACLDERVDKSKFSSVTYREQHELQLTRKARNVWRCNGHFVFPSAWNISCWCFCSLFFDKKFRVSDLSVLIHYLLMVGEPEPENVGS